MAFIVIAVVCFEGLWLHCAHLKTSFLSYRKSANMISVKKLLSKGSWDIPSAQEDMELSSRWTTRNPIHIIHQSSREETAVIISTWSPHRSLKVMSAESSVTAAPENWHPLLFSAHTRCCPLHISPRLKAVTTELSYHYPCLRDGGKLGWEWGSVSGKLPDRGPCRGPMDNVHDAKTSLGSWGWWTRRKELLLRSWVVFFSLSLFFFLLSSFCLSLPPSHPIGRWIIGGRLCG